MFRKPLSKKLSQSDFEIASLQKLIVELDEPSEEAISGGAIALPSFLNQANKPKQAESEIFVSETFMARQPEAEGKIRGTLLLSL
jgi:hypothetical protein